MPRTQNQNRGQEQRNRNPRKNGGSNPRGGQGNAGGERSYLSLPTSKELGHQTRAATQQKFRPLEKAITGDIRASERRVKDEGNWWQNYLNTVNAGQADTSAAYAQAAQTNQAQIGQASAIDTANTEKLQGEAAKSAELRGAAPSTAAAERESAAQAQRNYLAAAQGGATAQMGANQRGYLNEQKRIGVGQSIASRKEEQRIGRSKRKDLEDARRERGNYSVEKYGELADKNREYLIQKKAFGLDKRKQSAAEREGRQAGQTAAQEAAEKRRQQAIENRQEQEKINNETRSGGKTPSEKNEAKEGRRNAAAKASQLIKAHGYPKTAKEWADLEEAVAKEAEVSPADAARTIKRIRAKRANSTAGVAGAVENATPHFP